MFFLIKDGISKKSNLTKKDTLVPIGKVDTFEKNNIYPFLSHKFYLKRFEDGGFMALSVKCTHLGCMVNLNSKTGGFNCPCHASQFDQFGEVTSSPATRPLDIFPVIIKNDELYVDTGKPKKRQSFHKSQLSYT